MKTNLPIPFSPAGQTGQVRFDANVKLVNLSRTNVALDISFGTSHPTNCPNVRLSESDFIAGHSNLTILKQYVESGYHTMASVFVVIGILHQFQDEVGWLCV